MLTFSTICLSHISINIYLTWKEAPVLTVIGSTNKAISELDFPSVTICAPGNNIDELSKIADLVPESWSEFWKEYPDNDQPLQDMEFEDMKKVLTAFVQDQIPGWSDDLTIEDFLKAMTIKYMPFLRRNALMRAAMQDSGNSRPMSDVVFNPSRMQELQATMTQVEQDFEKMFAQLDMKNQASKDLILTLLWFTSKPCKKLIKYCSWQNVQVPCEDIFKVLPTDIGFCCSANHAPMSVLMRNSSFSRTIESVESKYAKLSNAAEETTDDKHIKFVPKKGKSNGLTLVLDMESYMLKTSTFDQDFKGFQASVGNKDEFIFMKDESFLISPGQVTNVAIEATSTSADSGLDDMTPQERKCMKTGDLHLSLFGQYSLNNCWMESLINATQKTMNLDHNCVPWNLPMLDNTSFCTPKNGDLFKKLLDNTDQLQDLQIEKCLSSCESQSYKVAISSAPFRRCDQHNMGISFFCNPMYPKPQKWSSSAIKSYNKTMNGSIPEYIENNLQEPIRTYGQDMIFEGLEPEQYNAYEEDIALVTFYFANQVTTEITITPKMNFLDYVSQVGGLLGLFLGCSVVSIFEIIYWFTIGYWKKIHQNKASASRIGDQSDPKNDA